MRFIPLFALIGLLLLRPGGAGAVGVAVKPTQVFLEQPIGMDGRGELLVANNTSQPALYDVAVPELSEKIIAQPASFRLEPGEGRIVALTSRLFWPRQQRTEITVVGRSLGVQSLSAGAGVKIPLTVTVAPSPAQVRSVAGVATVCLVGIFAVQLASRKKSYHHALF